MCDTSYAFLFPGEKLYDHLPFPHHREAASLYASISNNNNVEGFDPYVSLNFPHKAGENKVLYLQLGEYPFGLHVNSNLQQDCKITCARIYTYYFSLTKGAAAALYVSVRSRRREKKGVFPLVPPFRSHSNSPSSTDRIKKAEGGVGRIRKKPFLFRRM